MTSGRFLPGCDSGTPCSSGTGARPEETQRPQVVPVRLGDVEAQVLRRLRSASNAGRGRLVLAMTAEPHSGVLRVAGTMMLRSEVKQSSAGPRHLPCRRRIRSARARLGKPPRRDMEPAFRPLNQGAKRWSAAVSDWLAYASRLMALDEFREIRVNLLESRPRLGLRIVTTLDMPVAEQKAHPDARNGTKLPRPGNGSFAVNGPSAARSNFSSDGVVRASIRTETRRSEP